MLSHTFPCFGLWVNNSSSNEKEIKEFLGMSNYFGQSETIFIYTFINLIADREVDQIHSQNNKIIWSRILPEKLLIVRLFTKFPEIYRIREFIAVFTASFHIQINSIPFGNVHLLLGL
jgi:hypothetical protein